ncbi:peptidase S10, serine carboxypeptidase [Coemansia reversa NRRL 1564]|uniref:Carboxypeptidase n=1 Tax=Coemansia reversa (strain ATCC 12441 / NRRL 1564) TaxID=763665 RepID=A0A2G5B7L9_COERN|nr:peptidase S10, serine carboxypeptidase [Coemansia reversa NRRL 1564]|eukprot:PIA14990.1 peptidase S10, serine carboxypeptidase [Coemansia reversa NRRL 1564]
MHFTVLFWAVLLLYEGLVSNVLGEHIDFKEDRVLGLPYRYGEQPVHESYSGHITVRTWTPPGALPDSGQAKLFYWYFPAIAPKIEKPPLLLWLQGGPGSSSMIGLFTEMGPLELTDDGEFFRRNVTWANEYDLLFVDQPAGTGFSSVSPPANLTVDDLYPLARRLPENVTSAWRAKYPGRVDKYAMIESPMSKEFIVAEAQDMLYNMTLPVSQWPAHIRPFVRKFMDGLSARSSKIANILRAQWEAVGSTSLDGQATFGELLVPSVDNIADPFLVNNGYRPRAQAKSIWETIGLSNDENDDFVNGYATNMRGVGKDMWTFLQRFFARRPELQSRAFYIMSESYGGKYAPGIATYIEHKNEELAKGVADGQIIKLQGVLIGNSLVHPPLQVLAHGGIGFAWGLFDADQADTVDLLAFKAASYALTGDLEMGNEMRLMLFDYYRNVTGDVNSYDIRLRNHKYKRTYLDRGLNQQAVRRALHSENIPYSHDWGVYYYLAKDIMRTTAPLFPYLLERGLQMQLVQGQFDFRDGVAGNTLWINEAQWDGKKAFAEADRQQWLLGKELLGYARCGGRLTHRVVLNAGHMAPGDQPKACQDMVDLFVGLL